MTIFFIQYIHKRNVLAAECIRRENPRENVLKNLKPLVKRLQDICGNAEENRFKVNIINVF